MLMLDAIVWTGKDAPTLAQRKKMLPQLLASNVRKIDRAFYSTVFTRDVAGASEPMIGDVVADARTNAVKGRDAAHHMQNAWRLANASHKLLSGAKSGLAAQGCDVSPLLPS